MAATPCATCKLVHEGQCRSPLKRFRSQEDAESPSKRLLAKVCQFCQQPATDLCICNFPPTLLCGNCVQLHRMETPDETHNLFPVSEWEKVNDEQECLLARVRVIVQSAAIKQLTRSLPDLPSLERELVAAYDAVIAHIEVLKSQQREKLQQMHKQLQNLVSSAALSTRANILDLTYKPQSDIERVIMLSTQDTDPAKFRLFSISISPSYPLDTLQDPVKLELAILAPSMSVNVSPLFTGAPDQNLLEMGSFPLGEASHGLISKLKLYKTNLICFSAYERAQQRLEEEMELHLIEDGKNMALDRAKLLFETYLGDKLKNVPPEFVTKLMKWTERTYTRYHTVAQLSRQQSRQGEALGSKCNYCEKYTQQSVRCRCGKMDYCGQDCLCKDEAFHTCTS